MWLIKNRIHYRIVGEYEDDPVYDYETIQKTSLKPLTMRRLIKLIDNAQENGGLIGNARQWNYEYLGDAEQLYDFTTISPQFYPQLSTWYDARLYEETGMTKDERLEEKFWDRYLARRPAISPKERECRRQNKKELEAERRERE